MSPSLHPHFWLGNQGRKKLFNLLKVLKSVTGVKWCLNLLNLDPESTLLHAFNNCAQALQYLVQSHCGPQMLLHLPQCTAKRCPLLLVLLFVVFETESLSSPDWPRPLWMLWLQAEATKPGALIYFFLKSLFIEVLYISLSSSFSRWNRFLVVSLLHCFHFIMKENPISCGVKNQKKIRVHNLE